MNLETFKIICRAHYPDCEFSRTPLGDTIVYVEYGKYKYEIAIYEDFGTNGNNWDIPPVLIPMPTASNLYKHLHNQDQQKTR